MMHGYIHAEITEFHGLDKHKATWYNAALDIRRDIRVGAVSYHFHGYSTSIIERLLADSSSYFFIDDHTKSQYPNCTLMIEVVGMMKGASDQLMDNIKAGVGGTLGTTAVVSTFLSPPTTGVQITQSVLGAMVDGKTVADRTQLTSKVADVSAHAKPSKLSKFLDKCLNSRVHVMIGCHYNANKRRAAQVIDTGVQKLTCPQMAAFLMGRKPALSD